ncbi:hypothetical protein SISNIDRAFT_456840 [Sistotremastrum niveocremeum HHB9708]|uniref:F-box domain-containing protein n=1 Tax=Sistotremastrum niveocremeum HHB9708 TaxID=1314777 RepID=A0A164S8F7_9AGAM|nr:hypothetical protein SISNIDRAFT_456840 [Sistotremastrum niveocremeum HHB9708]
MLLVNLPSELIVLILDGLSSAEILNVSKTCRHLRILLNSDKRIWLSAADAHLLPIPMGYSLRTMDTEHVRLMAATAKAPLGALATAVAFTKRYNSELMKETPRSTGLIHEFSETHIELIDTDGHFPKAHLLPGSKASIYSLEALPGSEWAVIHLGESQPTFLLNTITMERHDLEIGTQFHGCASHELEDPKQIVLVIDSSHGRLTLSQLHIFVLTFTEDSSSLDEDHEYFQYSDPASNEDTLFLHRLEKQLTFDYPRNTLNAGLLIVNESYLAIPGWERPLLLINWKQHTGCWIAPHEEGDPYDEDLRSWTGPRTQEVHGGGESTQNRNSRYGRRYACT